jgi:inhibitor of cysteine peptidase
MLQRFDEDSNGETIDVRVGVEIEIALDENRTTGYRWILEASGEPVCTLAGDEFTQQDGPPGSGGRRSWRFRTVQPGTARIAMFYGRPWEASGAAAGRFSLSVRASG